MKILVLPDAHLHLELLERVDQLLEVHPQWSCVSLGDWADDWQRPVENYKSFFDAFVEFCRKYKERLSLCWGNHDYGYWNYPGCHSGYMLDAKDCVRHALSTIQVFLPIDKVYKTKGVIFSHAGLTKGLFERYKSQLHRSPSTSFIDFCNELELLDCSLDDSPLWHRPHNNYHKNTFNSQFLQVVGHTPVPTVTHTKEDNILYTDTWSTDSTRVPLGDKSLVVVDADKLTWEIIPYE